MIAGWVYFLDCSYLDLVGVIDIDKVSAFIILLGIELQPVAVDSADISGSDFPLVSPDPRSTYSSRAGTGLMVSVLVTVAPSRTVFQTLAPGLAPTSTR